MAKTEKVENKDQKIEKSTKKIAKSSYSKKKKTKKNIFQINQNVLTSALLFFDQELSLEPGTAGFSSP